MLSSRLCSCLTACFPRTRVPIKADVVQMSTSASGSISAPIDKVAKLITSGESCRIIVLTGAGVSVSAGIPDFRTPGTGLYDNLQEYGLPYAEAIFDLDFFREKPTPFYRLCQELWPGRYAPTPTHRFIRLLHEKGLLVRCFTQNIDSLESAAGLPKDKIVAAHGNFDSASVVTGPSAGSAVDIDEVKEAMGRGEPGWKELVAQHGGLVKPDIVFFGEALPRRFFECAQRDFQQCDLLLVMGTSLVVQPFASLIDQPRPGTPRLLINREKVGVSSFGMGGFDFDSEDTPDGFFQGDSDEAVAQLAVACGWKAEFEALAERV